MAVLLQFESYHTIFESSDECHEATHSKNIDSSFAVFESENSLFKMFISKVIKRHFFY